MTNILETVGNIAALVGILICLGSGVTRLMGSYYVLGYEALTLFIGGMALMVAACLAKLQIISAR